MKQLRDGSMAQQSIESKMEVILEKLKEVGASGLTKGGLGIKNPKSAGARALKALEEEREVANLGTPKKTRYVLIEFYKPLEIACDQVESNARESKSSRPDILELLSRKDLGKGCEGEIHKKVDEAVDWLVKEHKLLRFRRGRSLYCVHAENVKGLLLAEEAPRIDRTETTLPTRVPGRPEVLDAYRRVKERLGYSNVEISELQKEIGVPMDHLKAFLLDENRGGSAVLSLGDWSLSSEETRSGAIELLGKPHLLVKLRDEA
ncbi:MAG: hypothetical protein H6Q48_288 [Deltaproteobacteria bacterium]|jgi:hypothetical protein|nr:hypothetical protein [Deltaproteobacteria bacterium]